MDILVAISLSFSNGRFERVDLRMIRLRIKILLIGSSMRFPALVQLTMHQFSNELIILRASGFKGWLWRGAGGGKGGVNCKKKL